MARKGGELTHDGAIIINGALDLTEKVLGDMNIHGQEAGSVLLMVAVAESGRSHTHIHTTRVRKRKSRCIHKRLSFKTNTICRFQMNEAMKLLFDSNSNSEIQQLEDQTTASSEQGLLDSGNKRGKFSEQSLSSSPGTSGTVYRILCPSRKIVSVLGKGGEIIKALREDTQAKITVAESVPGLEERVVMVYIYDTIVADDLLGGTHNAHGSEIAVVECLLVPNNKVRCIIGNKGDVITRLRSETGASKRVMPTDLLPTCAMSTNELVQILAAPAIAKRAMHVISTLLHQNPQKDKAPAVGRQGMFRPGPTSYNFPPTNLMRPGPGSNGHGALPPWMREYATKPPRFRHDGFNGFNSGPPAVTPGQDPPMDFSMKIRCSSTKIRVVIGTAGSNVRQLQQETRTNIHVGDAYVESVERVICVVVLLAATLAVGAFVSYLTSRDSSLDQAAIGQRTGDSRGFAFDHYKYADEAQKAFEKLDGEN
ncbi:K homology domain-containing protein [Tanacetum coccineum]